jgi:ABC-type branched-subunit amino acid transport system permease subunit
MAINGLILLLVILFLPNGLASLFSRKRRSDVRVKVKAEAQ